ncbi:MAG: family 1 glycosylhydrolase [Ancrocorticia sp.]|jgi:beta-glucosidase|nr:family 1 glycosylhydrolase [Ancrocorticia sp.]MCI2001750.1 family 1 glycosylhydrolase [Ancrocorticia sp.]MCI2013062.1 family 1 glycosylhydrolase [Ancrocorticia sp.]MCI2029585.1 family 1 glycosylhydrolase [Ancrocorticia sp.]
MTRISFPADFYWGAATAAHQIEGGNTTSDWWYKEHLQPPRVETPSGDACDSYHRYREDMKLLADAGLTMYRFSIEWARVEPAPGEYSFAQRAHYGRMIEAAREYGLEPMVTLHHFTLPQWLERAGGWLAPGAIDRFEAYVAFCLPILDNVTWICTINEPNMVAIMARMDADRAAGNVDLRAAGLPEPSVPVARVLRAAHDRVVDLLHSRSSSRQKQVGWSVATQAFQALPGAEEATRSYGYPRDAWFIEQAARDDWIGIQAYTRTQVGVDGPLPVPESAEKTLTGWEYYPHALAEGIQLSATYAPGVPIFVTENGIATDDDNRRIDYVMEALRGLAQARRAGIVILGYLYWSLLDNYEWGSYRPTFGLVGVDRQTFERIPRPSLEWLGSIAQTGGFDA